MKIFSKLSELTEGVAVVVLEYVNANRADHKEDVFETFDAILSNDNLDEVGRRLKEEVRYISERSGRSAQDDTGRRAHLEFFINNYTYLRSLLQQAETLTEEQWGALTKNLQKLIRTCEELKLKDAQAEDPITNEKILLKSLAYQTGASRFVGGLSGGSGLGKMGTTVQNVLFSFLKPPTEQLYNLQLLDLVMAHRALVAAHKMEHGLAHAGASDSMAESIVELRRQQEHFKQHTSDLRSKITLLEQQQQNLLEVNQCLKEKIALLESEQASLKEKNAETAGKVRELSQFGLFRPGVSGSGLMASLLTNSFSSAHQASSAPPTSPST